MNVLIIGKDPDAAQILVDHPNVSRTHCRLLLDPHGQIWLEDLGSSNGTFLDGHPVPPGTPVRAAIGQTVGLGRFAGITLDASHVRRMMPARPTVPPPSRSSGAQPRADGGRSWTIGRDLAADIVLDSPNVSAIHARLTHLGGDRYRIEDLGSTNGLRVHRYDHRVQSAEVGPDDTVFFGSHAQRVRGLLHRAQTERPQATTIEPQHWITIGRAPGGNGIVVDHPVVSRQHARIRLVGGGQFDIEDLGSANGVFVNGHRITDVTRISEHDALSLGSHPFAFDLVGQSQLRYGSTSGMALVATGITVDVPSASGGSRRILTDVGLTVYAGELVALMGPSGAGKTTLMRAMNGYQRPTYGTTTLGGTDLYENYEAFRGAIGYVPQDDIVFPQLTVAESLRYTARLRLPRDTTDEEIEARVERVLRDLQIESTRDVKIGDALDKGISGGQRKRVNLAQELLTDPPILFLDEPTSGLSSGDTMVVMRLLRQLADEGRTIVVTIHQPSLKAYRLFDNVAYLFEGRLAFYGPAFPDSITFFQPALRDVPIEPPDDATLLLYDPGSALDPLDADRLAAGDNPSELAQRAEARRAAYAASRYHEEYVRQRASGASAAHPDAVGTGHRAGSIAQVGVLTQRSFRLKLRDRGGLLSAFLFAPFFAALACFANRPERNAEFFFESLNARPQALVLLVMVAYMFSSFGAANDIVGEAAVLKRERMASLRVDTYVVAKALVHAAFSLSQAVLLTGVAFVMLPLDAGPPGILAILWLVSMCGASIGLLASAAARTSLQAILLVVGVLALQIVIGGTTKPLPQLPSALRTMSLATTVRWGNEAILTHEYRRVDVQTVLDECAREDTDSPRELDLACRWQDTGPAPHYGLVETPSDESAQALPVAPVNTAETCLSICRRVQHDRPITPVDVRYGVAADDPVRVAAFDDGRDASVPAGERGERGPVLRSGDTPRDVIVIDLLVMAAMTLIGLLATGFVLRRRLR